MGGLAHEQWGTSIGPAPLETLRLILKYPVCTLHELVIPSLSSYPREAFVCLHQAAMSRMLSVASQVLK